MYPHVRERISLARRLQVDAEVGARFIVGGTIGVPLGTILLTGIDPTYLRIGVGILLILYSIYGLAQPRLTPLQAGASVDSGIGFLNGVLCNGVLCGITGLPGFIINYAVGPKTCSARCFSLSCWQRLQYR